MPLFHWLYVFFNLMSVIEWIAFVLNVICVYLIVIEKDVNWPIGILGSGALAIFFWRAELFANFWLQIFYVIEGVYGWWMWTRRDKATGLKLVRIGKTKLQTAAILTVIGIAGTGLIYPLFYYTHDPAPFWDSLTAVASVVAEYMLCIKLYEAWALYFATDLASLAIFAALGFWITFGTYTIFTVLCLAGIFAWHRSLKLADRRRTGHCEHCGYLLRGLPAPVRCPECGTAAADVVPAGAKLMRDRGPNPLSFTVGHPITIPSATMWKADLKSLETGTIHVAIQMRERAMTFREVIAHWRDEEAFRQFFVDLLRDLPMPAYKWETPCLAVETLERPFEFVALASPGLDRPADPDAFANQFRRLEKNASVLHFPNLGGDAVMVAPRALGPLASYVHLGAFMRAGPPEQRREFWRVIAHAVESRLSQRPLWLSTAGMGVAWLHARLDSRPKYYGYEPYRISSPAIP